MTTLLSLVFFAYAAASEPGCLKMVQNFCDQLHQGPNPGNLKLKSGEQVVELKLGRTANDIDEAEYAYHKAKITYRKRLPKDFRALLDSKGYFEILRKHLERKPLDKMTPKEFNADLYNRGLAITIWENAQRATRISRMEKLHPGFSKLKWLPRELAQKNAKAMYELDEQIAVALWEKHPNWSRTKASFEKVRKTFVEIIQKELPLNEVVKEQWIKKINAVELFVPGTNLLSRAGEPGCESTLKNAFYSFALNKITVCAGYFNTHEVTATLTHELAHALDPGSAMYDQLAASGAGELFVKLRQSACSRAKPDCASWSAWKSTFRASLNSLGEFQPVPLKFAQCLQRKADLKEIDLSFLERSSRSAAIKHASDVAKRNDFLELAKDELILPDGTKTGNPGHLNPCGLLAPKVPVATFSEALETFFVNEYQCADEGSPPKRLDVAIASAKELTGELIAAERKFGGRFSRADWMMHEKYALPIGEQFADVLGMHAYAKILRETPSIELRRHLFFGSTGHHCPSQSLSKAYPEEYEAQKKHSSIRHSKFYERFEEALTQDVREALGCKKDFEREDCRIAAD